MISNAKNFIHLKDILSNLSNDLFVNKDFIPGEDSIPVSGKKFDREEILGIFHYYLLYGATL